MAAAATDRPASAKPFPWADVMSIGFGLLRLSPQVFWQITPREFERAASAMRPYRTEPPTRADLRRLMHAFPDAKEPR